jgi:predicted O-methyltransferase YrrM
MYKIFSKILNSIRFRIKRKNYNKDFFVKDQNNRFKMLELDRETAILKLSKIKKKFEIFHRKMSSEHEILFSALSEKLQTNKFEILEIGTYDGINSYLLSLLFENSKITTMDLDDESEEFVKTYERNKNLNSFIIKRNKIISEGKNIHFIKKNSIHLINSKNKFDLIWIDGAHGYPTVCMDIVNSLHVLKENGIVLCDDVFMTRPLNEDQTYRSIGAYQTLKALENEKLIELSFLYKRIDELNNCDPLRRKFIAFFKKN